MKPIIKWLGGKRGMLKELKEIITPELLEGNTYYEVFAGGAALALDLEHKDTVLNDLNSELINMYTVIRDKPEELIKLLKEHQEKHCEDWFYFIRGLDKSGDLDYLTAECKAARTIYLNKTCFNGLYRVNKKGFFNSPIGKTSSGKTPDIVQEDNIRELSKFLKTVTLCNEDYKKVLKDFPLKAGDIVYLDSPYNYEETGFTSYQKEGWTNDNLVELKQVCDKLVDKGVRIIISNNSISFVRDLFNDSRYAYTEVLARRAINSKGTGRGPVKEIIIYSNNCKNNQ